MNQGYYRYPAIAGDRIVFVCEDDLWSVAAGGGTAVRLTASFGTCSFPRISPDGRHIAFVSTDEGNPEVYAMPFQGGVPVRLTFLGASQAVVCAWSPDGSEIYFVANPVTWDEQTRPFAVTIEGTVRELGFGHARSLAPTPAGGLAIGRNAVDPARWKRYRGGTSGEIWVDWSGSGAFRKLPLPDGNPTWPMPIGERLYFLSDHEGHR
jgi:tricorn protease